MIDLDTTVRKLHILISKHEEKYYYVPITVYYEKF